MSRLNRNWSPILLAMLLLAILVGVSGAGTRVSAQVTGTRQLIVPAAQFHPWEDGTEFQNYGHCITPHGIDTKWFVAWVPFPVPYYATVEKFELIAYDNTDTGRIIAWLQKTKPVRGTIRDMAYLDTGVNFKSSMNPRTWVDSTISYATVKPAEAVYVYLQLDPKALLVFHGVRIWYHPGL